MAMAKFDGAVENQEFKKLIHKTNIIQRKYGQLSMDI
jgi:hypothetical protein